MNCLYCVLKNLINSIKDMNLSCNVPQPLEVTGVMTTSFDIPQPLTVNGTINTVTTDICAENLAKILSQSQTYSTLGLKSNTQFTRVENLTVDGYIVSFTSQDQKIQTTLCNIEYVSL